jgi:hypothetical protein
MGIYARSVCLVGAAFLCGGVPAACSTQDRPQEHELGQGGSGQDAAPDQQDGSAGGPNNLASVTLDLYDDLPPGSGVHGIISYGGALYGSNSQGGMCSATLTPAEYQSFAVLATSQAVLDELVGPNACQTSYSGGESIVIRFEDSRILGSDGICPDTSPITMLRVMGWDLVRKYCPAVYARMGPPPDGSAD